MDVGPLRLQAATFTTSTDVWREATGEGSSESDDDLKITESFSKHVVTGIEGSYSPLHYYAAHTTEENSEEWRLKLSNGSFDYFQDTSVDFEYSHRLEEQDRSLVVVDREFEFSMAAGVGHATGVARNFSEFVLDLRIIPAGTGRVRGIEPDMVVGSDVPDRQRSYTVSFTIEPLDPGASESDDDDSREVNGPGVSDPGGISVPQGSAHLRDDAELQAEAQRRIEETRRGNESVWGAWLRGFFEEAAIQGADQAVDESPAGVAKGLQEAITGENLVTGEKYGPVERGLSALAAIPFFGGIADGAKAIKRTLGAGDDLANAMQAAARARAAARAAEDTADTASTVAKKSDTIASPPAAKPQHIEVDGKAPKTFRGGNSLKARLGVDVKPDADGLIQPVRNGKPQGLSVNIDPKDKFIDQYGGAFPVNGVPDGLQVVQSGRPGHFVIAPTKPLPFDDYQKLLDQVDLGTFNDLP